jgi:hypothetical protein
MARKDESSNHNHENKNIFLRLIEFQDLFTHKKNFQKIQ